MKTTRIFNILKDIASDNPLVGGTRVCAAIIRNKTIIAIGSNSYQTHPLQRRFARNAHSLFLHAEISALARARYRTDLTKCDMYIIRLMADNSFGLAKPCPGCMKAIKHFGIRKVYYTNENIR